MKSDLLKITAVFCLSTFVILTTSCTVDQEAGFLIKPAKAGDSSSSKKKTSSTSKKKGEISDWEKRMQASKAKRDAETKAKQAKLAAVKKKADKEKAREKARELAEKKKEDQAKAKALAEKKKLKDQKERQELAKKKKVEEANEKALAEKKKLKDQKRKQELAEKKKAGEEKKSKALAAKNLAEEKRKARELASAGSSNRSGGRFGGLFTSFSSGRTSSKYKSEGHYVFVNQVLLSSLSPSNAKVEIDLSDQRVRVYKTGAKKQLVIESSVSSGKSGHNTPTGTFRIKEKLTAKRSTLYGRWTNSSGSTIPSAGESGNRPSGATAFVGASMPYWMRISGGVGMHIGHVPNYPASHGCIRVPSSVQPLIFSKVGVGTSVTIKY